MSRQVSTFKAEHISAVVTLHEEFDKLKKGVVSASREFINNMADQTVKEGRHKVGVKTGATKKSIKVNAKAKYTRAEVGVESWLDAWLQQGGGRYHKKENANSDLANLTGRAYRKSHYTNKRKKIKQKNMLKSHPAYYLLRPAKSLMRSVKSQRTYERYMRKQLERINING